MVVMSDFLAKNELKIFLISHIKMIGEFRPPEVGDKLIPYGDNKVLAIDPVTWLEHFRDDVGANVDIDCIHMYMNVHMYTINGNVTPDWLHPIIKRMHNRIAKIEEVFATQRRFGGAS
jgi:hypothetical protein